MTDAILFPGQGAQAVGMGKAWADHSAAAREVFERANDALGFDLRMACWSGDDDVNRTDLAQPGIFTASAACMAGLSESGQAPEEARATAGLSLGEYTALWWAGVLSFEDGVRLVRLRGEAMQAASEACPSGMVSLVGAELAQAEALAEIGSQHGICAVANRNAPGQIVLSGSKSACEAAEALGMERGWRAKELTVAGAFHSALMAPAAAAMQEHLEGVDFRSPSIPVWSNVTAQRHLADDPEQMKRSLVEQITQPVRWSQSCEAMFEAGPGTCLELAPGKVLKGLMRRINRDVKVLTHDEPSQASAN